jgi:hypothetical protein
MLSSSRGPLFRIVDKQTLANKHMSVCNSQVIVLRLSFLMPLAQYYGTCVLDINARKCTFNVEET